MLFNLYFNVFTCNFSSIGASDVLFFIVVFIIFFVIVRFERKHRSKAAIQSGEPTPDSEFQRIQSSSIEDQIRIFYSDVEVNQKLTVELLNRQQEGSHSLPSLPSSEEEKEEVHGFMRDVTSEEEYLLNMPNYMEELFLGEKDEEDEEGFNDGKQGDEGDSSSFLTVGFNAPRDINEKRKSRFSQLLKNEGMEAQIGKIVSKVNEDRRSQTMTASGLIG